MEMTDEDIELLLQTIGDPDQLAALADDLEFANRLRNYRVPGMVQAGRVVVADPFGPIAAMFVRGKGERLAQRARDAMAGIRNRQADVNRRFYRALFPPNVLAPITVDDLPEPDIGL
ncbi:MAG: hypothetical protein NZ534_00020 [Bacteroidia bacterium]|nr:hypothetical protein [Bacteroidia bacterium]